MLFSTSLLLASLASHVAAGPKPEPPGPAVQTIKAAKVLGATRLKFGPSATQLTGQRVEEGFSTRHRITVDGLEPGTTYYVQVGARNAAGTATSAPVPVITSGKKKRS